MKAAKLTQLRGFSRGLLTAFLTLGLLANTGFADEGCANGSDRMSPGGGSSGGIGTVPDEGGSTGGLPLPNASALLPQANAPLKPALRLVGSLAELNSVVARTYSANGTGWFKLTPVTGPLGQGQMSIEFFGDTVVELNRVAFARSGVSVQLSVAPSFAGGVAVLSSNVHRTAQGLATGSLDLKLHRLVQAGLADAGLVLKAKSKQGAQSSLKISGGAEVLRLAQNH
jgi:hypothetical protein